MKAESVESIWILRHASAVKKCPVAQGRALLNLICNHEKKSGRNSRRKQTEKWKITWKD